MGLRRHEYGDAHAVAVDTGIRHVATNPHTVFHSALSSVPRLHSDLLVFHPLRGNVHIPIKPSLETPSAEGMANNSSYRCIIQLSARDPTNCVGKVPSGDGRSARAGIPTEPPRLALAHVTAMSRHANTGQNTMTLGKPGGPRVNRITAGITGYTTGKRLRFPLALPNAS